MEKLKVLLVEDEVDARGRLAKVIRKEGFEVLEAKDGKEGIDIFAKELPEIVITDLRMPNIDGVEVMHRVKRISPNVQIIVITAYGEVEATISAIREGAIDYLRKPLDLDELTLALGRAAEKIYENKDISPFPSLLLAEDDDTTRERLARILMQENWNVVSASNGTEAIEVFNREKVDVAILDIRMPKMDGLTALHEMRKASKDFEAIILTGYGDETSAIQALRDGAFNFIRKPIDLEELIISIEKSLEKLNTTRSLKYRLRELELSKQIIARFTENKEIVIDTHSQPQKQVMDFARNIIEMLPMGMVIVDKNMKVRYANEKVISGFNEIPDRIDDSFIRNLKKLGISEISLDHLTSAIIDMFTSEEKLTTSIPTGQYSYLVLIPISIQSADERRTEVVIVTRGERAA